MEGKHMAMMDDAQKVLGDADYPCTRDQLVEHAQKAGAGTDMINDLRNLPDRKFQDQSEVTQALGAE